MITVRGEGEGGGRFTRVQPDVRMKQPIRVLLTGGGTAGTRQPGSRHRPGPCGRGHPPPLRRRAGPGRGGGRAARRPPDSLRSGLRLPGHSAVGGAREVPPQHLRRQHPGRLHPPLVPSRGHRRHRRLRLRSSHVRGGRPAAAAALPRPRLRARAERGTREAEPAGGPAGRPRVRHLPGNAAGLPRATRCCPGIRCGAASPRCRRRRPRPALDFQIPAGRRVVFVFGGSQGARTINRAVVDALRHLLPCRDGVFVIHGTGLARPGYEAATRRATNGWPPSTPRRSGARSPTFYVNRPYFYQIEHVYAAGGPRRRARRRGEPLRAGVAGPAGDRDPEGQPPRATTR